MASASSGNLEESGKVEIAFPFENTEKWEKIQQDFGATVDSSNKNNFDELEKRFFELMQEYGKHSALTFRNFLNVKGKKLQQLFYKSTLPFMKHLILNIASIFEDKKLYFLHQNCNNKYDLNRLQACCILCCCFFGLFDDLLPFKDSLNLRLSSDNQTKFTCWIVYFETIHQWYETAHETSNNKQNGKDTDMKSNDNNNENSNSNDNTENKENKENKESKENNKDNKPNKENKENKDNGDENNDQMNGVISVEIDKIDKEKAHELLYQQYITIYRRQLSYKDLRSKFGDTSDLSTNNSKLGEFTVLREGGIQDCPNALFANFANEFIGGGVMHGGNVQEEILFTVNPENLIAKFLAPQPMLENESIITLGTFQYFNYTGYGSRLAFNGERQTCQSPKKHTYCHYLIEKGKDKDKDQNKEKETEKVQRVLSIIVGIDAICFWDSAKQYKPKTMIREMCKAYVGFSIENDKIGENCNAIDSIATGNWGCGMFNGDPQLKSMLQWIVATLCNRKVYYYTYGDKRVCADQKGKDKDKDKNKSGVRDPINDLEMVVEAMKKEKITVGKLWTVLQNYAGRNLFDILNKDLNLGL